MHIVLIAKPDGPNTGLGRYTHELRQGLEQMGCAVTLVHPTVPMPEWLAQLIRRRLGWDLKSFFDNRPIWARYPKADIYHIASQNLASLMLLRPPPGRTVLTVHDIFPQMHRNDPALSSHYHIVDRIVDAIAMWGLRRIPTLLAVSSYTKECLVEFGIAPERIHVTLEGVALPPGVDKMTR